MDSFSAVYVGPRGRLKAGRLRTRPVFVLFVFFVLSVAQRPEYEASPVQCGHEYADGLGGVTAIL